MRIISVTARQFGPFTDRTLDLAEGLTLVWGSNEAGKSSWHAALYAGLCGVRRSKGGTRTEDRTFRDRHRPWEGSGWSVEALVELAGGRRIRLQQDLDGSRESKAWDDSLGRDVSAEIAHDGTPDGARWLGLDRRTFLSVACVRQGDILAVRDDSATLQEYLQRAAATASSAGTAAAAIEKIRGALSELVGVDRTTATKPLRRAIDRVARARGALEASRQQHDEYRHGVEEADALRLAAEQADLRLAAARLTRAMADLEGFHARLARVRELLSRHPEGPPVSRLSDETIEAAAAALRSWDTRPAEVELSGVSAAELHRQIEELPDAPAGDCVVHPAVLDAHRALARSLQALEIHDAQQPPHAGSSRPSDLSASVLRDLARALEQPVPVLDPVLEQRRRQRQQELDRLRARQKWGRAILALACTCLAGGVAALLVTQIVVAAVLLLISAGAFAWWMSQAGRGAEVRILEDLRGVDSQLGDDRHAIALTLRQQQAAREEAAARGVKADASALQALADSVDAAERLRADHSRWNDVRRRLVDEVSQAQHVLESALRDRGVDPPAEGVDPALRQYEEACLRRSEQAAGAARRAGLMRELAALEVAERLREEGMARRASAERELVDVAGRCGVVGQDAAELSARLREWQSERLRSARQFEADSREWAELDHLLDGASLERLDHEETELALRVEAMRGRLNLQEGASLDWAALDGDLPALETAAQRRAEEAAEARGKSAQRARDLTSVVEAEEEVALAEAELARVRRLEQTLTTTLEYLKRAQDRVHRDLAPVLASTIRNWLPVVTDGRYVDVRVDPESLVVNVCDPEGHWRDAGLLSQGTSEQVYLVLRMAMAVHLTPPGEPCPLLFDEVTVQSDQPRTEAMLRTLQSLAEERQVVLFSQEQHVLEWMERHATTRDRVVRLDAPLYSRSRSQAEGRTT